MALFLLFIINFILDKPNNLQIYFILEDEQEEEDGRQLQYDDLYPGHIPTTLFQKILLSAGSAAMSLYDPRRDGEYNENILPHPI